MRRIEGGDATNGYIDHMIDPHFEIINTAYALPEAE